MNKGPACGQKCKDAYSIEGNEAPCLTCMPVMLPENQDAWAVYLIAQTQVITAGMDGTIIGIDYLAVDYVMEMQGVTDKRTCFAKVLTVFNEIQAIRKAMADK